MSNQTAVEVPVKPTANRWPGFLLGAAAFALCILDQNYAAVVGPDIEASTGVGVATGSWMFVGYFVVVGATMLPLARLTDRIGRVRALTLAMGALAIGDLIVTFASAFPMVVAGRLIAALALAITAPLTWGLGSALFHNVKERRVAFTWLTLGMGVGGVAGSLLGAWLTASSIPRSGFLLILVLAVLVAVFGWKLMPQGEISHRAADVGGIVLFILSFGSFLLGLKLAGGHGLFTVTQPLDFLGWQWSSGISPSAVLFLIFLVLAVAFVMQEAHKRRTDDAALFPIEFFSAAWYTNGVLGFGFLHFVLAGLSTLTPALLHFVQPPDALTIALIAGLLPVGIAVGALCRPFLSNSFGDPWALAIASIFSLIFLIWGVIDPLGGGDWHFAITNFTFGVTMGVALGIFADTALVTVPQQMSSTGASMLHTAGNTFQGIGALVLATILSGVAVGAINTDTSNMDLSAENRVELQDLAKLKAVPPSSETELIKQVEALRATAESSPSQAQEIRNDLYDSYQQAWRIILLISAILVAVVGLMSLVLVKGVPHRHLVEPATTDA